MPDEVFRLRSNRSLAHFLEVFFLRYPGVLGPAQAETWEFWDTYDGRWGKDGKAWVRNETSEPLLVQPPSWRPLPGSWSDFGLQSPVLWAKAHLTVQEVRFSTGSTRSLQGWLTHSRHGTFLALGETDDPLAPAIIETLAHELERVTDRGTALVAPLRHSFVWPSGRQPAAGESALTYFVARLRQEFTLARQYEKVMANDVDTECLHQYRTRLRRARSIVRLGQKLFGPSLKGLSQHLQQLMRPSNELRDLDVLLISWESFTRLLPPEFANDWTLWKAALEKQRQIETRSWKRWLKSESYQTVVQEFTLALDSLSVPGPAIEVAALPLLARLAKLRKIPRALGPSPTPEQLHQARIQLKKGRYSLEMLSYWCPPRVYAGLVKEIRSLQDRLGAFQDLSVILHRVSRELEAKKSALAPLPRGVLWGTLWAEARQMQWQVHKALLRLASPRLRKVFTVLKSLESAQQKPEKQSPDPETPHEL